MLYHCPAIRFAHWEHAVLHKNTLAYQRAFGINSASDTHGASARLFAYVWSFLVMWWCQIAQHALYRCPVDPGGTILDQMLNILTQARQRLIQAIVRSTTQRRG
jgi:hypothetical protein